MISLFCHISLQTSIISKGCSQCILNDWLCETMIWDAFFYERAFLSDAITCLSLFSNFIEEVSYEPAHKSMKGKAIYLCARLFLYLILDDVFSFSLLLAKYTAYRAKPLPELQHIHNTHFVIHLLYHILYSISLSYIMIFAIYMRFDAFTPYAPLNASA